MSGDVTAVEQTALKMPAPMEIRPGEAKEAEEKAFLTKLVDGYRCLPEEETIWAEGKVTYPFTSLLSDLISYYSADSLAARKGQLADLPQLKTIMDKMTVVEEKAGYRIFRQYADIINDLAFGVDYEQEKKSRRLSEGVAKRSDDEEMLIARARLNQEAANCIFQELKGLGTKGPWELSLADVLKVFAKSRLRGSYVVDQILSGAKSHGGMMHFLWQEGFYVQPLDPNQDQEIILDVRGGIDFAAVNPKTGTVYFIDAKSRNFQEVWAGQKDDLVANLVVRREELVISPDNMAQAESWIKTKLQAKRDDPATPEKERAVSRKVLKGDNFIKVRTRIIILPNRRELIDDRGQIIDNFVKKDILKLFNE